MKNFKKIKIKLVLSLVVFLSAGLIFSGTFSEVKANHPTVPVDDQHLQELMKELIEDSLIGDTLTTGDGQSIADINEQIMIAMKALVEKQVGIGALPTEYEPLIANPETEAQNLGLTSWDGLAQEAQKDAIQQLLSSLEGAIFEGMTGFPIIGRDGLPIIGDGSPLFVTNLLGFLDNVGVATFFDFLSEENIGGINPFRQDGELPPSVGDDLSALLEGRFERSRDFQKRVTPLYALPPGDATAFTQGDFSAGGWEMWFALSQDPARNPWTLAQTAEREAERRAAERIEEESELLRHSGGLFPMREADGTITTPGIAFADQLGEIIGSDLRQLEMATDFDSIFNLFLGDMFNEFFSGGVFGFDILGGFFDFDSFFDFLPF